MSKPITSTISDTRRRLRAWRKRAKLTQAEASKRSGVRQSAWSQIENAERIPSVEQALRIELLTAGKISVSAWTDRPLKLTGTG